MPNSSDIYENKLVGANNFVTFSTGATDSSVLDCNGASIVALRVLTGFTAGNIKFNVASANKNSNLIPLKLNDGTSTDFQIAVIAPGHYPLDPSLFAGVKTIQVISNPAQSSSSAIEFVLGPLWQ